MAVLQEIREKTVLVLFMIGIGMFGFLFMGSDQSSVLSCNPQEANNIGSIDGVDVLPNEFSQSLDLIKGTQQYQNYPEGQQVKLAWDKLVQDKIINVSTENIGLDICSKEVYEFETGNINVNNVSPHFSNLFVNQETRQFDRNLVDNWLENFDNLSPDQKSFFLSVESEAIKTRYTQKYQSLIEKGMYTTSSEAISTLDSRGQNASVRYVSIPYSSVTDLEITEEEIVEYYNNNISDFQNDIETRNVEYVTFTVVPSSQDDINVREELITLSSEFKDSDNDELFSSRYSSQIVEAFPYLNKEDVTDPKFAELITKDLGFVSGPYKLTNGQYRLSKLSEIIDRADSVEARHILLTSDNFTTDSAKTILRDIKKQVKSGADFGKLAATYSEDKGSAGQFGHLGWFTEGQMVPEFNDVCFSSKEGDLKIVSTQFGVHLIQVTGVSKLTTKYKIVHLDKEVVASTQTKDLYYSQANDFINAVNNKTSDTTFSAFAESQNQLVREDVNVDNMKFNIAALENSREIVKWMFTANVSDISNSIYTCGDNYVVISLSVINEKGDRDLESVRDQIIQTLQLDKKYETIVSKITEGSTLESVAVLFATDIKSVEGISFANTNINELGNEPNFVGIVNSSDLNTNSSVIRGNNSAYILSVTSKLEGIITEVNVTQKQEIQTSNSSGTFFNSVMNILKDKANVVDNRVRFY